VAKVRKEKREKQSGVSQRRRSTKEEVVERQEPVAEWAELKKWMKISIGALFVVLILLAIFYIFVGKFQNAAKNTVESPFANVRDKRILEIRKEGIKNYQEGVKTGDKEKLASAMSDLQKVVTAHPTDVISRVYLQNTMILLQARHNKSSKGKKIFVEIRDNESQVEENIKISSALSKRKDLLAVIGPIRSPLLSTAAPFFDGNRLVLISPTGSCPDKESLGDYVFRTSGDGMDLSVDMSKFALKRLKLKKIAVVYDPTQSYSKLVGEKFVIEVIKLGGAETRVFTTSLDNKNYSDVLKEIKKYGPDGVYFVAYQDQQGRFAKQMKKMGINVAHLTTTASYSQQLITEGGKAVEGIILNSYFFPNGGPKGARKFSKAYAREFPGVHPNFRAALSYDSFMVISEAVNRGITTSGALLKFLKKTLGKKVIVHGATGNIKYDKHGVRQHMDLIHITVKRGRFRKMD